MTHEIFISYSRKDLDKVKSIKKEIEQATGIECWMDLDDIHSDERDYLDRIVEGIENCNVFVFMLSSSSQESEHAVGELLAAQMQQKKRGIHVVVVNIDNCEMNMKFTVRFATINVIFWNVYPQKENLFRDLKRWTDGKMTKSNIAGNHPQKNSGSSYDVILTSAGAAKLQMVKAVKEILGIGLKEAKELVDEAPSILCNGVDFAKASSLKNYLEEIGGIIDIKLHNTQSVVTTSSNSYSVLLGVVGAQKLQAVKLVKEACGIGLKEAKDLVDGAPSILREGVSYLDAQLIAKTIRACGAKVYVCPSGETRRTLRELRM